MLRPHLRAHFELNDDTTIVVLVQLQVIPPMLRTQPVAQGLPSWKLFFLRIGKWRLSQHAAALVIASWIMDAQEVRDGQQVIPFRPRCLVPERRQSRWKTSLKSFDGGMKY